ncbi:MAG: leucine-rich repeat protein [Prevotella sp.]|nr:leucine-rich repeat protein [Prevotella sp.]
MKQIKLTFLLTVLMSMVGARASAHDFEVLNSDGYTIYYVITSETEVAVSYRGSEFYLYVNTYMGNLKIPESVIYDGKSYNVTSINESTFYTCTLLRSVEMPNSITSIGDHAFHGCTGLKSITIPSNVTTIGKDAFSLCTGLKSITIPNSVTSIGNNAFQDCRELESVIIGNSVTSIGNYAFGDCNSLTSIIIPHSVTSIGGAAFYNCSTLTSVIIDNSITSIGNNAFDGCSSLTDITIPYSVTTMGNYVFRNCSSLTSIYVHFNRLAEWANGPLSDNKAQLATKLTANAAGTAKYSTYYFGATVSTKPNLVADENTTVYKAKQKDASTLTLTTIDDRIIPDATAVVLKTTEDEIVLRYTETAPAGDFTDNILEGSNTNKDIGSETYYVLGLSGGNIGFYEFTGSVLAAGKAYIPATSLDGMSARGLTLEEEDGETTGIESLTPTLSQGEGAVYDLQGRRVENPTKGIYIVNGKKVVIR